LICNSKQDIRRHVSPPRRASAEMEKATAMVRGIIERHEGKVLVIKKWDERKLAYEMRGTSAACISSPTSRPRAAQSPASSAM